MKRIVCIIMVMMLVLGEVIQFDNNAIEKIFQNTETKSSALFLFGSDNEQSKQAKKVFEQLSQDNLDIILTISNPQDGHGLYDRLANFVGIKKDVTPQVLLLVQKKNKYMFGDNKPITKDNLKQFIQKVNAGQIPKTLKSDPPPLENNQPVKVVVGSNFKEVVLGTEKQVLVKFYAPSCIHCKNLAPHFDAAAKRLTINQNINLVKIDATTNEVEDVEIEGFPTLKFYGKDKSKPPTDYNGARDTDGIIKWLKDHTEYPWKDIQQVKQTFEQL